MCQTECKSNRKFFNLNITLQKNFMLLNLEEQEGKDASIQLHNRTSSLTLEIEQKGVKYTRFQVLPNHKVPFSWIEPLETKEIIVKVIQFENPIHQFSIEIDKIGEVINTELPHEEHDKGLYYIITLEGSSRVIKFLDYHFERRQTSSSISEKVDLFRAKIPAFGISLISAAGEKKVELLYIKFSPIQFLLEKKEKFTSMHLRIKSLKIDNNCVEDQIYPLMVFPENTAKLDRGMYPFLDFILKINNRAKPTDV